MASARGHERPLRIGLNLLWLGERAGGVGRYAGELPGALLEADPRIEITVFAGRGLPRAVRQAAWSGSVRWTALRVSPGTPQGQLAELTVLPALAAARGLDVVHSPANTGPVITPGSASVVSVMDLIWLEHADEWNPDPRAQRANLRQIGFSVRHADRVLAISQAAAEDLTRGLGIERSRIGVTPLGVRPPIAVPAPEAAVRERLKLTGRRVVLCVAQKRRYKNLALIVRALPELPDDVAAVLPGSPTAYEAELRALAAQLGVSDRVRFPDWVSEAELGALYALATAFALPTLTEGFGLPVLEAMAHGLPVACSELPVMREVAGDAALFFDPHDRAALVAVLTRLLDEPATRADLRKRGLARVRQFSWRRTGEATIQGYRDAIATRTGA